MFRIMQVKVPFQDILDAHERNKHALERLQGAAEFSRVGDDYMSEPMVTTSAKYFIVEQYLRSMFGDPPHLFVDLTSDYKLLRTRAPQAYDYGYVIEVGTMEGESGPERLVAMPREKVEYQSGRYSSGLYTPVDCS